MSSYPILSNPAVWLLGISRKVNPVRSARVTFSVSVHTWMALGMRRAVFSFVMEQTSFRRTVSYTQKHTNAKHSGEHYGIINLLRNQNPF